MFTYFARLHQKFALPVYPIVIFSYDRPQKEAILQYKIEFPDLKVLEFNYQVVQLNRLNWRDFINQPNPVAAALMAKMKIAPRDRAKVKAQCLRLLVTLRLDAARMQLISGFVDTYLNLNSSEEIEFQQEISTFIQPEQEGVMQITTSWMRRGLEQGLEQGLERGLERGLEQGLARERNLIIRLIKRKLGAIDVDIESRIMPLNIDDLERVGEALLDFSTVEDLTNWLNALDA
jgi:flagellar biosynthesis/type III secretory pathway protein FliH